jgi:tetratricopeptide (TPR) repeat protein
MKRVSHIAWLFLACAVAVPRGARAGTYGTESPFVLGVGSRASGMGMAASSLYGDPSLQMFNPAALGRQQYAAVEFFHTTLFESGTRYSAVSAAYPTIGFGTVGVTALQLGVSDIERRDTDNVLLETFSDTQSRVLVGYGWEYRPGFAIGANLKVDHHALAGVSGTGVGLDFGVVATAEHPASFLNAVHGAVVALNVPGPSIRLDLDSVADPRTIAIGGSAVGTYRDIDFTTATDVALPQYSPARLRIGQEFEYHRLVALRIGLDASTVTYGLGARYHNLAVDYAYRNEDLGGNHRISLVVDFGRSRDERERDQREALQGEVQQQMEQRIRTMEQQQLASILTEADQLFAEHRYDDAAERYATALVWTPGNPHASERQTQCRYRAALARGRELMHGEQWAGAVREFEQVAAIAPDDSLSLLLVQCRAHLDASALERETVERLLSDAIDLYSERQYARAADGFTHVLEIDPAETRATEYLRKCDANLTTMRDEAIAQARQQVARGRYEEAVQELDKAARSGRMDPTLSVEITRTREAQARAEAPDSAQVQKEIPSGERERLDELMRAGLERYQAGDFTNAGKAFMEVWETAPDFENVRDVLQRTYLLLGMEHFSKNRTAQAIRAWETVLQGDPGNVKAARYLARAREEATPTDSGGGAR